MAPVNIRDIIDACGRDEAPAWGELWPLIETVALVPLSRLLHSWHLDPTLADDALQDFFLYLRAQNLRRLQRFDGNTEAEFQAFLRTMAVRFFLKRVRRWHHARQREAEAQRQFASADRERMT